MENPNNRLSTQKELVVVMRGPSAVIFRPNDGLVCENVTSSIGPVRISVTTRWLNKGEGINFPGHLWIDIRGNGPSLSQSLVSFANAGLSLLPILSLSANAAIGEPDIEVAFDNSENTHERDYFQTFVPPETSSISNVRSINVSATIDLLEALITHPDFERFKRCANQYRLSLDSWRLGRESLALAHQWIALEVLTPIKIRSECKTLGLAQPSELAHKIGIENKDLDAYIRKELLLKGDAECYKKAREASNGFEHGYLSFDEIHELSRDVRHRMASYVRTAFLELSGVKQSAFNVLTSEPYAKPMGHWPLVKYLRGKLISESRELAVPENAYPFMRWKHTVKKVSMTEYGELQVTFDETFTAELAKGVQFQPVSYEAWRAE